MRKLFANWFGRIYHRLARRPGDWHENEKASAEKHKPYGELLTAFEYDPDAETRALLTPVKSPVLSLIESVRNGDAIIEEAWLCTGRFNEQGRMMPAKLRESAARAIRIKRAKGNEAFLAAISECEESLKKLPDQRLKAQFSKRRALDTLRESKLREDYIDRNSVVDEITTNYDRSQFTEYTPIMGGPFHKQMYMFDGLRSLALAFEAFHHNPIAKRIADIITEYTIGRGFKMGSRDQDYLEQVNLVVEELKLQQKVPVWSVESVVYGELLIDNLKWQSIDPSTIWQIVHEPDDVNKEIYAFQSYPTDYMSFTGYKVKGAPGSEKIPGTRYIVRQIPASQYIHVKENCVSNEVRGRSTFFPIHGWLKMAKDLLESKVVRAKLEACFVFDDTVIGSDTDVIAHAQQYSGMPVPGSVFAHNENVKRVAMQAITGAGSTGVDTVFENVLSVIATNTGIPKEHLNVSSRGGSRATALVSSEPWTKVIEGRQIRFEKLIHDILSIELPRRGIEYRKNDIEVTFPEVTKDTTTERIANLNLGVQMGYISARTAAQDFYAQMNMSNRDFETEQETIRDDKAKGLDQVGGMPPPPSRSGAFGAQPIGGIDTGNEIHGEGKGDLQDQLQTL